MMSLCFVFFCNPAFAQELPKSTAPAELKPDGTDIFRGLLDVNGIEPWRATPGQRMLPTSSEQYLVIVYGDPGPQAPTIMGYVNSYHSLIAIRGPYEFDQLLFGSGDRVTDTAYVATDLTTTPDSLPKDQREQCPFVVSIAGGNLLDRIGVRPTAANPDNPFTGYSKIATRLPSLIRRTPQLPNQQVLGLPMEPVAMLPSSVRNRHPRGAAPTRGDFFAMVGKRTALTFPNNTGIEATRLTIAMADEHPFSNQLLALEGTDNLAFTMALIKNFKARGVTHCIFYEYGEPVTSFDDVKFRLTPTMPPLPIPPPHVADMIATQVADQAADQLDQSNTLNNFFRERPLWLGRLISILLGIILAAMIWTVFRKVWSKRHRPDQVPMPTHPFAKIKTAAGLVGQLQRDVIVGGDYGPVVRDYLRDLFASLGFDPKPGTPLPALPPPLKYDGKPENGALLYQDLTAAWQIYAGEGKISLAVWKTLEPKLSKLWKAAHAGRWHFADVR